MTDGRVSIVIPAYNAERWIARAIDSALGQDWPDVEVIVVNDGSTDNTERVCLSYGSGIRYFWQENRGVSAARNKGIELATGATIGFLDADDELLPHMVSTLMDALRRFPAAEVASGAFIHKTPEGVTRLPPEGAVLGAGRQVGVIEDFFRVYARFPVVVIGTVLVRRSVFDAVGLFRTDLRLGEDPEMWSRIAGGHVWVFVDREVAVYNNFPENSVSLQVDLAIRSSSLLNSLFSERKMKAIVRPSLRPSYRRFRRDRTLLYCKDLLVRGEVRRAREGLRSAWPVPPTLEYLALSILAALPPGVVRQIVRRVLRFKAALRRLKLLRRGVSAIT